LKEKSVVLKFFLLNFKLIGKFIVGKRVKREVVFSKNVPKFG